jgi:abortive infection bacteriophage resistance protein
MTDGSDRKIYNTLVMIAHLMDVVCINHQWKQRLVDLIQKYEIDVSKMGFPDDWQAQAIWPSETTCN